MLPGQIVSRLPLLLCVWVLASCNGNGGTPVPLGNGTPIAEGVLSVNVIPSFVTLRVGERTQGTASVSASADVTDRGVSWRTSDPSIATVDANGLITAVKPGTTTLIAMSNANKAVVGSGTITVQAPPPTLDLQPIMATFDEKARATRYAAAYMKESGGTPLTYSWSGPDCGDPKQESGATSTAQGELSFLWNHDHPPCDATTNHAQTTILLTVRHADFEGTCRYQGAATGTGAACTVTRKATKP